MPQLTTTEIATIYRKVANKPKQPNRGMEYALRKVEVELERRGVILNPYRKENNERTMLGS
jgi:hypothetical protein